MMKNDKGSGKASRQLSLVDYGELHAIQLKSSPVVIQMPTLRQLGVCVRPLSRAVGPLPGKGRQPTGQGDQLARPALAGRVAGAHPEVAHVVLVGPVKALDHGLDGHAEAARPLAQRLCVLVAHAGGQVGEPGDGGGQGDPVAALAVQRDGGEATAQDHVVPEVLLHCAQEDGGRDAPVVRGGRGERRQQPVGQARVDEAVPNQGGQLRGQGLHLDVLDGLGARELDDQAALALVRDKVAAEALGAALAVDEEAELRQHGQADIVGPQLEMQVLLPGAKDRLHESIRVGNHGAVVGLGQ